MLPRDNRGKGGGKDDHEKPTSSKKTEFNVTKSSPSKRKKNKPFNARNDSEADRERELKRRNSLTDSPLTSSSSAASSGDGDDQESGGNIVNTPEKEVAFSAVDATDGMSKTVDEAQSGSKGTRTKRNKKKKKSVKVIRISQCASIADLIF